MTYSSIVLQSKHMKIQEYSAVNSDVLSSGEDSCAAEGRERAPLKKQPNFSVDFFYQSLK